MVTQNQSLTFQSYLCELMLQFCKLNVNLYIHLGCEGIEEKDRKS